MPENCIINHIGFLPHTRKRVIVPAFLNAKDFEVQDMEKNQSEAFSSKENWKEIFRDKLVTLHTDFGDYLIGDFSELTRIGNYRITLTEKNCHSYQFGISERIFNQLPYLFLDFIHNWRSGYFSNHWRTPTHLDDAVRSDNGKQVDLAGGWYDAGDTRKWMVHSNLPALGFFDFFEDKAWQRNFFHQENVCDNDFLTESGWALKFILKMQDKKTGMFFEDVGGGGNNRVTSGSKWWYENHAGCIADNAENYFSDNIPGSGDERTVRVQYNPIAQYTTITILQRAGQLYKKILPEWAAKFKTAGLKSWHFTEKKRVENDPMHNWTAVIAWRLLAVIEFYKTGLITQQQLENTVKHLLEFYDKALSIWWMNTDKKQPYRGILHSAQPQIALCKFLLLEIDSELNSEVKDVLNQNWEYTLQKLLTTNPFGFMPYGLFPENHTKNEVYRSFNDKFQYRFFMPDNHPQKINHGLSGHWTSWAHGLSLMGKVLQNKEMNYAAWDQLYWLLGANPENASMVTGAGYNQPMPHSRYLGAFPGGFMNGFIGDSKDEPVVDANGEAQWNTTEYWNTPLANSLMALAQLI